MPRHVDPLAPFDSPERYISFMNALRGNTHVERLDLSEIQVRDDIPQGKGFA
jgi:hypothetical protein